MTGLCEGCGEAKTSDCWIDEMAPLFSFFLLFSGLWSFTLRCFVAFQYPGNWWLVMALDYVVDYHVICTYRTCVNSSVGFSKLILM